MDDHPSRCGLPGCHTAHCICRVAKFGVVCVQTGRSMNPKLMIILVGLPARGKSTLSLRLCRAFEVEGVCSDVFNNGELRRRELGALSSLPSFYNPDDMEKRGQRDGIALKNVRMAKEFFHGGGQVAILDGTNADRRRRELLERELGGMPILYIECINDDPELLEASILRKSKLPEFAHLSRAEAVRSFQQRIEFYEKSYTPLGEERNFIKVNTLFHKVVSEKNSDELPYYARIRDILVSPWVRNLYLVRHGQSEYNLCNRIGGDPPLTDKGIVQAQALADHFQGVPLTYIFTSTARRSIQTADPLRLLYPEANVIALSELDEINAGVCENMRYEDIQREMPEEFKARVADKYNYIYPHGEGYATLRSRVDRGLRKALFLSGDVGAIMMIGHQAINRMILSYFLYRRESDVPHIYIPQDQYYHIVATQQKKLFEMVRFIDRKGEGVLLPTGG